MSESRVRENRTHGSRRRWEASRASRQGRAACRRLPPTLVKATTDATPVAFVQLHPELERVFLLRRRKRAPSCAGRPGGGRVGACFPLRASKTRSEWRWATRRPATRRGDSERVSDRIERYAAPSGRLRVPPAATRSGSVTV